MRPVLLHNFCSYLLFFCASTTQKLLFRYFCPFLHICPFLNAERPPFQITAAICMYCLFRYARAFGNATSGFRSPSGSSMSSLLSSRSSSCTASSISSSASLALIWTRS